MRFLILIPNYIFQEMVTDLIRIQQGRRLIYVSMRLAYISLFERSLIYYLISQ